MTNTPPNLDEQKRRVQANFNAMAPTYDALKFVQVAASRLLEQIDLQPGMRVLDIGTGTGMVAMNAANLVGATGKVVGVDLSPEMISRARAKAAAAGIENIEFREGDAEKLDFPDESFDAVLYGSSLFFVPNMLNAVKEAHRVLAPNGWVALTSFAATFMSPLRELWDARLRKHGIAVEERPNAPLEDAASCEQLLHEAGFARVEAHTEPLGYYLPNAEARWKELAVSFNGRVLDKLSSAQREQLKAEHLAELEALSTPQGIWFAVTTNFAFGWK